MFVWASDALGEMVGEDTPGRGLGSKWCGEQTARGDIRVVQRKACFRKRHRSLLPGETEPRLLFHCSPCFLSPVVPVEIPPNGSLTARRASHSAGCASLRSGRFALLRGEAVGLATPVLERRRDGRHPTWKDTGDGGPQRSQGWLCLPGACLLEMESRESCRFCKTSSPGEHPATLLLRGAPWASLAACAQLTSPGSGCTNEVL